MVILAGMPALTSQAQGGEATPSPEQPTKSFLVFMPAVMRADTYQESFCGPVESGGVILNYESNFPALQAPEDPQYTHIVGWASWSYVTYQGQSWLIPEGDVAVFITQANQSLEFFNMQLVEGHAFMEACAATKFPPGPSLLAWGDKARTGTGVGGLLWLITITESGELKVDPWPGIVQ